MRFGETTATFDETSKNTILDYAVRVLPLEEEDKILLYQGANYSVTGKSELSLSIPSLLSSLRTGNETVPTRLEVSLYLLSSLRPLRGGLLGRVPHTSRSSSRQDGHADHSLPRVDQHLQHRDHELPQRGGDDSYWCLDVGLHILRVRGLNRLRLSSLEEKEKLPQEKEEKKTD